MAVDLKYEYLEEGINEIISEKGNTFLALREVRWKENTDYKLDLRRYRSEEDRDVTLKGVSVNETEADDLTGVLVANGLGDDKELCDIITAYRPGLCRLLKEEINGDCSFNDTEDTRVKRLFTRDDARLAM